MRCASGLHERFIKLPHAVREQFSGIRTTNGRVAGRASYGIEVAALEFLPLGNDSGSWPYRVEQAQGPACFLKVRVPAGAMRGQIHGIERYAWAVQDIAACGEEIALLQALGQDARRGALEGFMSLFEPGNIVDLAFSADAPGRSGSLGPARSTQPSGSPGPGGSR